MAEIILSPILQVLFEELASKAGKSVSLYLLNKKRGKELPETIQRWKKKLGEMEAVLSNAEQQQFQREDVKMWLHDLQDWAYDLEDIMDQFATDVRLKKLDLQLREEEDSLATCRCSPFNKVPSLFTCKFEAPDSNIETFLTRIEEISSRLKDIQSRARQLKDLSESQSMEEPLTRREGTSSISPKVVFGRDDEKHTIIHRLLTDEPNYGNYIVIPVVGRGGIGKTTLAQSVYNDEQVKAHFNIKAWVCVSEVFDVHQITTIIIRSASNHKPFEFSNLNEAQEKLQDILSGKRFLIVLDDVCSDEYHLWEKLEAPFDGGLKGSRVIVTTRWERVAKTMRTTPAAQSHVVNLKGLSYNECWNICKQHALISDDPIETRTLVMELSKGLPLAAKALGGLLRQTDSTKWSKILSGNIWSKKTDVLPALKLSYYHLPHHLKRVFAYCSVFPKDHEMAKEDVVLMWMAEGFLPESDEESMEDNGHSYFDDLVSRSLFEPSSRSGKGFFIMHDLIHDLAQLVAGDVCCRIQTDRDNVTDRTRFLSLTSKALFGREHLMEDKLGKQLRTFAFWGFGGDFKRLDATLQQFQCLRVLRIRRVGIAELPSYIGSLKHLRYLDLSLNELEELPESMSKLCNLQSLVLKYNGGLTKVLNVEPFVELRHLDIKGSALREMPPGFGKLTNLRMSREFFMGANSGHRIRDLENLKYLSGSLKISGLENVMTSEDAARARMNEKKHLEILRMSWEAFKAGDTGDRRNQQVQLSVERDVLNQLKPPNSVKELQLKGYMGIAFPDWFVKPSFNKMVVIRLQHCDRCERLPQLGQLPALEKLVVESMEGIKSIRLEFYGDGCLNPFPALKKLKIQYMEHLEEWLQPNRAFPCLEKLSIQFCPLLQGDTPSFLPSLKTLHIKGCKKLKVTLPSCPLLEELHLRECRELCSIDPVICCSRTVLVYDISSFSGVEGFWVPDIKDITVADTYAFMQAKDGRLHLTNCPKLWYEFLESKFPSSVRCLTIEDDDSIKHISKLTNQSTCLLEKLRIHLSSLITISNLPSTLQELEIYKVNIEQPAKEWKLHLLTSLRKLEIIRAGSCTDLVESIPDPDLPLPSSLVELTLLGFENLKFISCSTLPYLAELIIYCPLMTREGIHVPRGFVFRSQGGMCMVQLNRSKFQLH